MIVLRDNSPSKGDLNYQEAVRDWQMFLRGHGYDIIADSDFGPLTRIATEDFQRTNGLVSDGKVGRRTLAKAIELGFDSDEGDNNTDILFPPKPTNLESPNDSKREDFFGKFKYVPAPRPGNPEGIRIADGWDSENIEKINIPQLIGITGAPNSGNVYFNKKISNNVITLFGAWEAAGLIDLILTWEGSYVPRFIRGSRTILSNHAYGSAFDINYSWNKLGITPALAKHRGSVRELVPIANAHGFFWGGHYANRKDGMHFEFAKF